ncbi:hypothetical protein [Rubrivirga sp. IMCC43871]|uniref:hypothetical protein n=1 Tax=Rubrivirga sp. IMCC43871 TaxID=3391575 RepID=UPI00398FDE24
MGRLTAGGALATVPPLAEPPDLAGSKSESGSSSSFTTTGSWLLARVLDARLVRHDARDGTLGQVERAVGDVEGLALDPSVDVVGDAVGDAVGDGAGRAGRQREGGEGEEAGRHGRVR